MTERAPKNVTLSIDETVYALLTSYCEKEGYTISRLVEKLVKLYLQDNGVIAPDA